METNNEEDLKLYDSEKNLFNCSISIEEGCIKIQLESNYEKYINKFGLSELKKMNDYFRQFNNLQNVLDDLNGSLEEEKYIIKKEPDYINLIIEYGRGKNKKNVTFVLNKYNGDISYENLSDKMKKIIDNNELVLGIDLGTTNSCAAVMIEDKIIMIRNSLGSTTTPSFIYFLNRKEVCVGELVKLLPSNEKNIIYNIKRLLGKNIDDKEVAKIRNNLAFLLRRDERFDLLKIVINFGNLEEEFYPEQISALILKKIIEDSEFYLSKKIGKDIKIKKCVITVPAYFNQKQRESTINSAKIIGLDVKTMINEPTSATLVYAKEYFKNTNKRIIVIDFGGGTLDITLLVYGRNDYGNFFDVKFAYGDSNFGGEDFDNILMSKCIQNFNSSSNEEPNIIYNDENRNNYQILRLKRACERAKINLSTSDSTKIHIGNYTYTISKSEFIEYCKELYDKFEDILNKFIKDSQINNKDKFEIILIGKTTLMPEIRGIIEKKFENSKLNFDLDPKETVAKGAAIRGAKFMNLSSVSDINLFDVTNLSLGIKQKGDIFEIIIPRSTEFPTYNEKTFMTTEDNQTSALIEVYEGEEIKNCSEKNLFLGKFAISGFPQKEAGKVKIEVRMEIDYFSILKVIAWEKINESNKDKIIIEKLVELPKIMNQLKERENEFKFIKNDNYNNNKYSIILSEEILNNEEKKEIVNISNIKAQYLQIFERISDSLKQIDDKILTNLYISIIKYYLRRMCDFFQKYEVVGGFSTKVKENIIIFFEKLNSKNMNNLIFEIIEEIVNQDNIKKSFIELIVQNLWNEVLTIFELTNIEKENEYVEELENLSRIKYLVDVCIEIINNFGRENNVIGNITKSKLEDMKLKIIVREIIFTNRISENSYNIRELWDIYYKYSTSYYCVETDLYELDKIIGTKTENLEANKAIAFIKMIRDSNFERFDILIHRILEEYPYDKMEMDKYEKFQKFEKFRSGKCKEITYLEFLSGRYRNLLDNKDNLNNWEIEVYNEILKYLDGVLNNIFN